MAVTTIASSARIWNLDAADDRWSAKSGFVVGSALYSVTQDSGASPELRVHKSTSLTTPSFSEQDSSNAPAVSDASYPFSAWSDGTYIHVVAFTGTNTLEHFRFNTSTDAWTTDFGQISTDANNGIPVRVVVRSDGDVLAFYTSAADSIDHYWARYEGSSWTETLHISGTSTDDMVLVDAVIDSADFAFIFYYDGNGDDFTYKSFDSSNAAGANADLDNAVAASDDNYSPANFALYDDSGTEKAIGAFLNADLSLAERSVTLETASSIFAGFGTQAQIAGAADIVEPYPVTTAVLSGTPYAAWGDGGSTLYYSTKSSGTWASKSTWKSSLTDAHIVQLLVVGTGLLALYQEGTTVKCDWIVAPVTPTPASITIDDAEAPAAGGTVALTGQGSLAVDAAAASAAGEAVTLDAAAKLTATAATAPAQAEAVDLDGNIAASLAVDPATAPASGQDVALTGQARLAVTEATAPAAGGTVNLTAAALFTIDDAEAPAQAEAVDLAAAAVGSLAVAPAEASAAGEAVTLDAAATFTVDAATASAAADSTLDAASALTVDATTASAAADVDITAAAVFAIDDAGAPAAGEAVDLTGTTSLAGTLEVAAATAAADGATVTLTGAALFTADTATATAQGEAVTLDAASLFGVTPATSDAAAQTIGLTGQAILAVTPGDASAAADSALTAAAIFDLGAAEATADGGDVILLPFASVYTVRKRVTTYGVTKPAETLAVAQNGASYSVAKLGGTLLVEKE